MRKLLLLLCLLPVYHLATFNAEAAPAEVISVRRDAEGITLKLRPGTLKLQVFSPRVIRAVYSIDGAPPTKSLAVIAAPGARVRWKLVETADEVHLRTDEMEVRVNRASGAVGFYDKAGRPVLVEEAGGGRLLTPARVALP